MGLIVGILSVTRVGFSSYADCAESLLTDTFMLYRWWVRSITSCRPFFTVLYDLRIW